MLRSLIEFCVRQPVLTVLTVLTAFTTFAALLPVMLATGHGTDVVRAMALPVFFGMFVELVSLFVVPATYCGYLEARLHLYSPEKKAALMNAVAESLALRQATTVGQIRSMNADGRGAAEFLYATHSHGGKVRARRVSECPTRTGLSDVANGPVHIRPPDGAMRTRSRFVLGSIGNTLIKPRRWRCPTKTSKDFTTK